MRECRISWSTVILVCLVRTTRIYIELNVQRSSFLSFPGSRINPFFLFLLSFFLFSHASALSHMHILINTLRVFVLPDRFRVMKSMWPNPTGRERGIVKHRGLTICGSEVEALVLLSSALLYLFNTDYLSTRSLIKHVRSPFAFKQSGRCICAHFSSLKETVHPKIKWSVYLH